MATSADGSYGSAAGIALIAKVLAGRCAMKYTRVAVGKGNIPDDKRQGFPFFQLIWDTTTYPERSDISS